MFSLENTEDIKFLGALLYHFYTSLKLVASLGV